MNFVTDFPLEFCRIAMVDARFATARAGNQRYSPVILEHKLEYFSLGWQWWMESVVSELFTKRSIAKWAQAIRECEFRFTQTAGVANSTYEYPNRGKSDNS